MALSDDVKEIVERARLTLSLNDGEMVTNLDGHYFALELFEQLSAALSAPTKPLSEPLHAVPDGVFREVLLLLAVCANPDNYDTRDPDLRGRIRECRRTLESL